MTNYIIAKRYARALLETGLESGQETLYGQQLGMIYDNFQQVPEIMQIFTNPAISRQERKDLWRNLLDRMNPDKIVRNFLLLLLDRKRLLYFDHIINYYNELLDEHQGIKRASVRSVEELDASAVKELTSRLEAMVGKKIILEVKGDPSLIGGMVAQIGDLVLDGSLKNELARLKDSLTRGD
ncbi:MAG: ATP synthase F1 subunit delta [Desulfarculales bacterium]|jgi:F-type H+-transporting ATPase subunit delta|nr:ATP synthase F1 subunit delta [Desulfarculales bacterium]